MSVLDVFANTMSTEESSCTVVAVSQMPYSSVSLEMTPVVPGGHLRPDVALGLTVSRRTVLGGMHTSAWVKIGQMSSGRSLAASVKCGPEASIARLLLDEVDSEDGFVPG